MRKNKKVSKKQSMMAMHAMHMGAVLVMLLVAVIVNQCASASCDSLMNKIGAKTRLLKQKNAELSRVSARWEMAKSKDGLQRSLDDWSMEMRPASPDRVVRIDSRGGYDARQRSVRLARSRLSSLARMDSRPVPPGRMTLRR